MKFAAVQFDIAWEDKPANHAVIEKLLAEAQPAIGPGTFVLLPELGDTGFSLDLDRIADDLTLTWASDLARRMNIYLQPGFARRGAAAPDNAPAGRNCAAIIAPDGLVLGEYQKVHPFSYGKESIAYSGGDHLVIKTCGDPRDHAEVCPMICYDLRFPELWRLGATSGAEVFTIGASWPAARQHHWRSLVIARAIENQAYVVAVNRCGRDPHLEYAGGTLIVSPKGEVVAESENLPMVLQAELDLPALRAWRAEFPALRDVHASLLGSIRQE
jgi:predicted amidohydrolase